MFQGEGAAKTKTLRGKEQSTGSSQTSGPMLSAYVTSISQGFPRNGDTDIPFELLPVPERALFSPMYADGDTEAQRKDNNLPC